MALERKWNTVSPQLFILDASATGLITLADTIGFKVKQVAYIRSNTLPAPLAVQVKRVISRTMLIVGPVDQKIATWLPLNLSAYTVASGAVIGAEEQKKNDIPEGDHYSAIYEADPTVADRVIGVDPYGDFYTHKNPFPVIPGGSQIVPDQFDEVVIIRDCEEDPTEYQFYLKGALVGTVDVTYDCEKAAIRYKGTNET